MDTITDESNFQDASTLSSDSHSTLKESNFGREAIIEEYEKKFEELDRKHFEKKVEKRVFENCHQNFQVAEFLHNHVFFPSYGEDDELPKECISEEERKYIIRLLEKKEQMSKSIAQISKKNRELEKRILKKRLHYRDCMQKRRTLWNKAAKIYDNSSKSFLDIEKSSFDEFSVTSKMSTLNLESQVSVDNEYEMVKQEISSKINSIRMLAGILQKLISFSGVKWSNNKNLLEILSCTGNLLESGFHVQNPRKMKKITDDVIHRLNFVKI